MLTVWVLARIVANPVSNVFQKQLTQRSAEPLLIIGLTHVLLALLCLPAFAWISIPESAAFWGNMVFCAVLAVASNVLLVYALKRGELSVLGPLNAYKSVVGMIGGALLIGEIPSTTGLAGVLLIVAGSYFVVDRGSGQGLQLRFAALALSATEAVFLKKALLLTTPMTVFVFWSMLGVPVALLAALLLRQPIRRWPDQWGFVWAAVATGVMQLSTVFTFGKLPVGYSLALFQLSTLISVFLGYRYFEEGQIRKRLVGSAIMVAGAVLIVTQKS